MKRWKTVILALTFVFSAINVYAEYNHELGVAGGISSYLGDANYQTPFWRPKMAVGGMYRYNFDSRWAIKLTAIYAEAQGDTRDFKYSFPGVIYPNGVEFKRNYVDASISAEFNFFDLETKKYSRGAYKATPYIMLGVGLTAYCNMAISSNVYRFNIPVGVGGKWKINKRWTLGLEWTIHKMFVDDFDVTDSGNKILDNPFGTPQNGFFDTDWYMICNLYITINLFDPNRFCK